MRLPALLILAASAATVAGCAHTTTGVVQATPGSPTATAPKDGARFVDKAKDSGITYRWEITEQRPLNILQTIGNGCAFLDYDNDGNLDTLFVGPKLALYHGDGKGLFTDVSAEAGLTGLTGRFLGCATGDYDNDGFEDVYISGYRTGLLLHNQAGKAFADATGTAGLASQPWGTACTFGDVDGDGKLDLYVGNYVKFGPDSRFQLCDYDGIKTGCGPTFYDPEKGVFYRNLGGGRFADATGAAGADKVAGKALGATFVDYDSSGRVSLAIANDKMPGDLLHNTGGRFQNVGDRSGVAYREDGHVQAGMGMDWGDYDNDGKLDLAVATFESEAKPVYRNLGSGLFEDESTKLGLFEQTVESLSFAVKWLDYDNDGALDLVLTNGHTSDNVAEWFPNHSYRQRTKLFHGDGGHAFTDVSDNAGEAFRTPIVGRGLAVGDYDNDGRVDVLAVDSEGAPLLLHNETAPSGHWLQLSLIGTKSNRDALGATVTVKAGGHTYTRHCHTDGSYLSASDRRVHVGLGTATTADVTVRWPSGAVTHHNGLAADKIVTLAEGQGAGRTAGTV